MYPVLVNLRLLHKCTKKGTVDVIIERDQIRRKLFNFSQWHEYKFTKEKERKVTEVVDDLIQEASRS